MRRRTQRDEAVTIQRVRGEQNTERCSSDCTIRGGVRRRTHRDVTVIDVAATLQSDRAMT